jgi:hypothetical protein
MLSGGKISEHKDAHLHSRHQNWVQARQGATYVGRSGASLAPKAY